MKEEWTHIRIRRKTKQRIEAIIAARDAAYAAGSPCIEIDSDQGESMDALIGYLCKMWEDRKRRRQT